MKNYSQELKDAIANDWPEVLLITMELSSANLRITSAGVDITYSGDTYISEGLLLDAGAVREDRELSVQSINLQFTAVDQTILALFQNEQQQSRRVNVKCVVLDPNDYSVVGEKYSKNYIIDSYSDDDDEETATVTVELTNWMSDFEAVRGIRTTQNSFARFYPNTTSFINSKDIDKEQRWGGE